MAKKNAKKSSKTASNPVKAKLNKVWDRYSPIVIDFLERESIHILSYMTKIVGLKKHLKKLIAGYALMYAGVLILLIGIATFLTSMVAWPPGMMHMVVGLVVLIISAIVIKT